LSRLGPPVGFRGIPWKPVCWGPFPFPSHFFPSVIVFFRGPTTPLSPPRPPPLAGFHDSELDLRFVPVYLLTCVLFTPASPPFPRRRAFVFQRFLSEPFRPFVLPLWRPVLFFFFFSIRDFPSLRRPFSHPSLPGAGNPTVSRPLGLSVFPRFFFFPSAAFPQVFFLFFFSFGLIPFFAWVAFLLLSPRFGLVFERSTNRGWARRSPRDGVAGCWRPPGVWFCLGFSPQ